MAGSFAIIRYINGVEEELASAAAIHTPHIASVLIDEGVFSAQDDLEAALGRAFEVCKLLGVPIDRHFRRMHVHSTGGHEYADWALSDLAWYLLLLNGQPVNPNVLRAQAYALRMALRH